MDNSLDVERVSKATNAFILRVRPQAKPCDEDVERWLRTTATGQPPEASGSLVERLQVMALQEAATQVCAHRHGLISHGAQLIGDAGGRQGRFAPGSHPAHADALARALLAGPAAACIADPAAALASMPRRGPTSLAS